MLLKERMSFEHFGGNRIHGIKTNSIDSTSPKNKSKNAGILPTVPGFVSAFRREGGLFALMNAYD